MRQSRFSRTAASWRTKQAPARPASRASLSRANMRVAADVKGHSLSFLPQGDRVVYLKILPSEELTEAQAELEKAGQRRRVSPPAALNWLLYKHVEIVTRSLSTGRNACARPTGF